MLILFKKNALFANLALILFDFQLHKYAKSFRKYGRVQRLKSLDVGKQEHVSSYYLNN